jgi:hypothetical protein
MFKERLKKTIRFIGLYAVIIAVIALLSYLGATFRSVGIVETILFGGLDALVILALILVFVYWLFIDPFRGKRQ